ncbi:hypothetical protein D3C84_1310300 [compost metagenome]
MCCNGCIHRLEHRFAAGSNALDGRLLLHQSQNAKPFYDHACQNAYSTNPSAYADSS